MARYDLHPDGENFLLDVQADRLDNLNTRVVVPVRLPEQAPLPARRLNPVFDIGGRRYVMVTQFTSAVLAGSLDAPTGDLRHEHDRITAALDMLFQGF
jgi:toxin CcdB